MSAQPSPNARPTGSSSPACSASPPPASSSSPTRTSWPRRSSSRSTPSPSPSPLLAVGLVTDYARRAGERIPAWREAIGLVGALAAVVGLAALFFHFGAGPGGVFLAVTAVGVVLVRML